jgi:hypothetical protein
MYYIIYETKNIINNKIYAGYHKTENLEDDYLGSGKILKKAIKKYDKKNFHKKILYVFPSKEEALLKEIEIVNEEFIKRDDTYNIKLGGEGGWDHTWSDPKRLKAIRKSFKEGRMKGWQLTFKQRSKLCSGNNNGFEGKTHSKESRKKIGEAQKLDNKIIKLRLKDFKEIEKSWGWKIKLGKKWKVSHTQVNRFIKTYAG